MLDWLRQKLWKPSPLEAWSVRIVDDQIITDDGLGTRKLLQVGDLRRVVVATDDSGPWGADFVFLLFGEAEGPVGLFPIEAQGRDEFIVWMSEQPGYNGDELQKAAGSTKVARFEVLNLDGR